MRSEMWDVLVIGGGPAGVTAALRARELGAKRVALVEQKPRLGGTCTNDGCVPTRVWAKAARLRRDAEQFAEYGLTGPPPELDFRRLQAQTREIVGRIHDKKRIPDHLRDADITVFEGAGAARFVDPHAVTLESGEMLRAETFILCAGGHARLPDFEGSELTRTPTQLWSLDELPASAVVVGAAATGCQIASILNTFGVDVTLLEMAPRVLPQEDADVSAAMAESLAARGVRVLTDIGPISRVERSADGEPLVVCFPHEGREDATASGGLVVVATGWAGNADALNLGAAGVDTDRGFVTVDDALRTSAPHIFAAGDITGRMMLVQSAYDEARVAAENAVRGADRRDTHRIVPHGGFTDPEYGSVGLTEEQAGEKEPGGCLTAVVPYADLDRAVIDGRTEGLCKLIVARGSGRVVGAHVIGEQALEVVQVVAAGMAARVTVDRLAELELAYPTFTGVVGLAARQLCREMGLIARSGECAALVEEPRATEWEHRADPE